jgi:hypothetical protein
LPHRRRATRYQQTRSDNKDTKCYNPFGADTVSYLPADSAKAKIDKSGNCKNKRRRAARRLEFYLKRLEKGCKRVDTAECNK